MPKYPAQIDNSQSLPTAVDNLTPVQGAIFNKLRDAVIAVESELGVKPSGTYTTVRARLDALEGVVGNLQIIELAKDLGGTLEEPKVIGFQGRPISTVPPHIGDVYAWNGIAWTPQAQSGGGGGGFSPPPGTIPGQTLVWDGAEYLPNLYLQDDVVPPLELTFTSAIQFAEVNQTITNPAFTATYEITPSLATLTDDVFVTPQDVTSTPTSFSSSHSFSKPAFNDKVTFTLTALEGHVTKSETYDIVWGQKTYYGTGAAGQTGAVFIQSLTGQVVTNVKQIAFSINATGTDKIYFACRTGYGDAVFTVHDVEGGFTKTQTVSVTNAYGFAENYDLYESDYGGLGELVVYVGDGDDEFFSGGGPIGPAGPAGQPGGGEYVIYRPGTADVAPAFSSWSAVVAQAASVTNTIGRAIILFDDSFAQTIVPAGSWDFGNQTTFACFSGNTNFNGPGTEVVVQDGATFVNSPVSFHNITLTSNSTSPIITSVPLNGRVDLDNSVLQCSNSNAPIYDIAQVCTFVLYNEGEIMQQYTGGVPVVRTTNSMYMYMGPGSRVEDNTVGGTGSLSYDVLSSSAFVSRTQTISTINYFLSGLKNLDVFGTTSYGTTASRPNLAGAHPGYRYFDTDLNTLIVWDGSAWITVGGGGTLAGDVTGPAGSNTVAQISGTGGNVDILASTQTSTANLNFQPFNAQAQFTATGAFEGIYSNYVIPANTGVQVDVMLVAISSSGTDFASWKLSFGAQKVGLAAAVTVGSNPSPSGVIPDRNTTGAAAWIATVVLSGDTVLVKGQAVSGVVWGISFQVLPINP